MGPTSFTAYEIIINAIIIATLVYTIKKYVKPMDRAKKELVKLESYLEDNEIKVKSNYLQLMREMEHMPLLKPYFKVYERLLTVYQNRNEVPHIEECFNQDVIMEDYGSRSMMNFMPGALTAMGILGTFFGLIMGLRGIDISSVANTQMSVIGLIQGISGAFSTSLVGIFCSLILSFWDRKNVNDIKRCTRRIMMRLERNNHMIKSSDVLSKMLIIQDEQNDNVRTLAEDLSVAISEEIDKAITPQIEAITKGTNNLIESVNNNQVEGMEKIIETFMDSVNAMFGDQFENMADTIEELLRWQKESKETMDQLMQGISETVDKLSNQGEMMQEAGALFSDNIKGMKVVSQEFNDAINGMQVVAESFEEQSMHNQKLMEDTAELFKEMNEVIVSLDEMVENLHGNTAEILKSLNDTNKELVNSSNVFASNVESSLKSTFGLFDNNLSDILAHLNNVLQKIKRQTEDIPDAIDGLTNNIQAFDETITKAINNNEMM